MAYDVKITYADETLVIFVNNNEYIRYKQNLMDRFGGVAYLGFSGSLNENNREINIASAHICESDFSDKLYYKWKVNGVIYENTAAKILAGTTAKLYVSLKDNFDKLVPHLIGQKLKPLSFRSLNPSVAKVTNQVKEDAFFISFDVTPTASSGLNILPYQIEGRNGITNIQFNVIPQGLDSFKVLGNFEISPTPILVLNEVGEFKNINVFTWDKLQNNKYIFIIEPIDGYGVYCDM